MEAMPLPISSAPSASRECGRVGRDTSHSAKIDEAIAASSDTAVQATS